MEFPKTIPELLHHRVLQSPSSEAFNVHSIGGPEIHLDWGSYEKKVTQLALAFRHIGVKKGDRIAILAPTSFYWELVDKAILAAGAVIVGIDVHATAEHIRFTLNHSKCVGLIIDSLDQKSWLSEEQQRRVNFIVTFVPWTGLKSTSMYTLEQLSSPVSTSVPLENVIPDDPATLIYTSGTTGRPKAILYTHRQMLLACQAIRDHYPEAQRIGARIICWLPLSNLFQRILNIVAIANGFTTFFIDDPREIIAAAKTIEPDYFVGVPRFFEKLYLEIRKNIAARPVWQQRVVEFALHLGERRCSQAQGGPRISLLTRTSWAVLNYLILRPIQRKIMGRRLEFLFTGSAPMAPRIMLFFHALGLPILEAYAMSENIVPMAMNRLKHFRLGSVGQPLTLNQLRFSDDGEILVKGPGLFTSYADADFSESKFTSDGFYKTGDKGHLNQEGFLFLTGRASDMIKTSTGRRIFPSSIEALYRSSPIVDQIVIFGHGQSHLAALIYPNVELLEKTLKAQGYLVQSKEAMIQTDHAHRVVENHFASLHCQLKPYEQLRSFVLLQFPFRIETGELTPSLKLCRHVIEARYGAQLSSLFLDSMVSR